MVTKLPGLPLLAALVLSQCSLEPSQPGSSENTAQLSMSLSGEQLRLISDRYPEQPYEINVHMSEVGSSEIEKAWRFPLESADSDLFITDAPIGYKNITIFLSGETEGLLAEGSQEIDLIPGDQEIAGFQLREFERAMPQIRLQLAIDGAPVEPPELPEFMTEFMTTYSCQLCHSAAGPQGFVDLETYPFVSSHTPPWDFLRLANEFLLSLENGSMPKFPPMPSNAEIAMVEGFVNEVRDAYAEDAPRPLPEYVATGQLVITDLYDKRAHTIPLVVSEDRLHLQTDSNPVYLRLDQNYEVSAQVKTADGRVLWDLPVQELEVSDRSVIDWRVAVEAEAARVRIGIDVVPAP